MKSPALWILVAFAAGIGILARWPGSPKVWIVAAALLILAGVGFACRGFICDCVGMRAGLALGGFASGVKRAGIPANHIARLIAADKIDTSVPPRWQGCLREDPMALPCGQLFEIDLEQDEAAGMVLPVSGGLRVKTSWWMNRLRSQQIF